MDIHCAQNIKFPLRYVVIFSDLFRLRDQNFQGINLCLLNEDVQCPKMRGLFPASFDF